MLLDYFTDCTDCIGPIMPSYILTLPFCLIFFNSCKILLGKIINITNGNDWSILRLMHDNKTIMKLIDLPYDSIKIYRLI